MQKRSSEAAEAVRLLACLRSNNESIHQRAIEEILALSEEQMQALIRLESSRHARRRKVGVTALMALTVLYLSIGCLFAFSGMAMVLFMPHFWVPVIGSYLGVYGFIVRSPEHLRMLEVMCRKPEARFLPALLTLWREGGQEVATERRLRVALKQVLPQVKAGMALKPEDRATLYTILRYPYDDVELTLAILKALEQIGTEEAVPHVELLAHEPTATVNMKRIRSAARDCLPFLSINTERQTQAETLLRASDAVTVGTNEVLLRPAMKTGSTTPQEELLHVPGE